MPESADGTSTRGRPGRVGTARETPTRSASVPVSGSCVTDIMTTTRAEKMLSGQRHAHAVSVWLPWTMATYNHRKVLIPKETYVV